MIETWFRSIELAISFAEFRALPKNPAYKYEYSDGRAYLSPRPKCYHVALDLQQRPVPETLDGWRGPVVIRPLAEEDWEALPKLFSAAFWSVLPFSTLDDARRLKVAGRCLNKTREGADGALIHEACSVAVDEETNHPVGACLVTKITKFHRDEELERLATEGVLPHLTWIFVAPMLTRHGIGSALLDRSVNALVELGHRTLASTFLLGNESSMLWHWSNGFRLLSYLGSPRRYRSSRLSAGPNSGTVERE